MTTTAAPRRKLPWHVRALSKLGRNQPPTPYQACYEPDLVVPAADGTPLLTDHYFPSSAGDFPTVLVRCPYGRGFPWTSLFAGFAQQGFHVVVQSCRGTGGSGGEFVFYGDEATDAHATVDWLRKQEWFTGALGTLGPSYLSFTQWSLALDPPPELRAMVIQVGVHRPYPVFYPGGAFALENALIAGVAMVYQGNGALRYLIAATRLLRQLRRVTRTLPLVDAYVPAFGRRMSIIEDPLRHPDPADPYWDGTDVSRALDHLAVPTILIGGWHDLLLDQTIEQYTRLRAAGCETRLLIGPWTHTSALEQGWPVVFPESVGWLRDHLTATPSTGAGRPAPVRIHVGGVDEWRDLPDWPPPGTTEHRWYAAGSGGLAADAPSPGEPPRTFRYDPADPTPSVGGPLLGRKGGSRDNTALEARPDVVLFTSEVLTEPVEIVGPVHAELRISTRSDSDGGADVFARLCDVDPDGRSFNLCDGLLRLPAGGGQEPREVTVPMTSAAHVFLPGHRIRLQVSGGAHPRFARNTGSGEPQATAVRLVPVDISVHHPSALVVSAAAGT